MQKNVIIRVSVCAIVIFILGFPINVVGYQTVQSLNQKAITTYYDRDIEIRAGVHELTNGNYGLGLLVIIKNRIDENIKGTLKVYWDTPGGKNLKKYNTSFNLVYGAEVRYAFDDRGYFLFPIVKLTAIVEFPQTSTFVLRSGIQIGRFVFF